MPYLTPAECVIEAFGGVRKTARALKRQPGAIVKWKERGLVPNALHAEIMGLIKSGKVCLSAYDIVCGRE